MVWGLFVAWEAASYYFLFLFSMFNSLHCKTFPFVLLLIDLPYVVRLVPSVLCF